MQKNQEKNFFNGGSMKEDGMLFFEDLDCPGYTYNGEKLQFSNSEECEVTLQCHYSQLHWPVKNCLKIICIR